jgi:hypothetical protein
MLIGRAALKKIQRRRRLTTKPEMMVKSTSNANQRIPRKRSRTFS